MGWLSESSESERAAVLAKMAGRAYLEPDELKQTENKLGMQRTKSKFISIDDTAEAWIFFTKDNGIIVACRGTEPTEFKDILADLKAFPIKHPRAGRVHRGFYEYAMMVYPEILEVVKKNRKKNENVYVVGHSLGGAMAVLVAEQLVADGIPVRELRTYGQPRVGTRRFREHLEGCDIGSYVRYVNNNDIVPKVPPAFLFYVHGGKLQYINYFGLIRLCTQWQRIKDQWRGWWRSVQKLEFFDFVRDHGMNYYIQYTSDIEKNDK